VGHNKQMSGEPYISFHKKCENKAINIYLLCTSYVPQV